MSDATVEKTGYVFRGRRLLEIALGVTVALALATHLQLVFNRNVNWDEFFYLHWVHRQLEGTLSAQLQTFHVHFFGWLPLVSQNEVDQIVAARLAIFLLVLGSSAFTYLIARHFLDRIGSLFALLCYLSFSYVIENGTSFRADPIAVFLFLASVQLLLMERRSWLPPALAGLAIACAAMVTIKAAFYLPVLGALLLAPLLCGEDRAWAIRKGLCFALAAGGGLAALYLLHDASLTAANLDTAVGIAGQSAEKVIELDNLFPRWRYLVVSIVKSPIAWLSLVSGAALLLRRALNERRRPAPQWLYPLIFLLPLGTLLIYRNSFPYYYAFILSPAVVVGGFAFEWILAQADKRRALVSLAWAIVLVASYDTAKSYRWSQEDRTAGQRELVGLVHELFPDPVAYIDRTTMIASFRKVGFFMSSWGMENYLNAGVPIFRDIVARERPPFLIASIASLDPAVDKEALRADGYLSLFDEDNRLLADNYVQHWGRLYVAGKTLRFPTENAKLAFEILIPGRYTLEAEGVIEIDGQSFQPHETLELAAGWHDSRALAGSGTAVLRWGDRLPRPAAPPSPGPLYDGFLRR